VRKILDEASQVVMYSHQLEQKSKELEAATTELRAANERLKELDRLYQLHKLFFFRSEEKNLLVIDKAICTELQSIMSDKAYKGNVFYSGPVNGRFNAATLKSLNDFMGWENYDVRIRNDDKIDKEVLEDIRANYRAWKGGKK